MLNLIKIYISTFLLLLPLQQCNITLFKNERFIVEELGQDKYRISFDIRDYSEIQSFVINVDGFDEEGNRIIPDSRLVESNGLYYFPSKDYSHESGILFKDNGEQDENKDIGVFSFTIDCSKWTKGRYIIKVSATNRPSKGEYFSLKELFVVDKGDVVFSTDSKIMESFPIWKDKYLNAYFPTLTNLGNDRLMLKFSTRIHQSHVDTTGGKEYLLSNDGGMSWSKTNLNRDSSFARLTKFNRKVVVDIEGWDFSKSSGEINGIDGNASDFLSKEIVISTYMPNNKLEQRVNFSVPKDVLNILRFDELHNQNGVRLISMYGLREIKSKKSSQVYFLRSVDDGKNWEFIYLTPDKSDDIELSETALLEQRNGSILAMVRGKAGLYKSISYDKGKSWTTPVFTGIEGYPASLLQLDDGRVLCVYGYRKNPMGIRGCISYDSGNSWQVQDEIVIRKDGVDFDGTNIGYPKAVSLGNGEVFLVYYIRTGNTPPFIAGSRLSL